MYVCLCHGISDKQIKKLVSHQGITDIRGVRKCTALGTQCGKCVRQAKEIINETVAQQFQQAS